MTPGAGVRILPLTDWPDPPGWPVAVAREAPRLRGRFDLTVLLRPDDPISGALVAAAAVPVRLGYACPGTRPFLTAALPPPGRGRVLPQALRLAAAAAHYMGATPPPAAPGADGPRLVPTAADDVEAGAALATVSACGRAPILLHPGAGWPLKAWPTGRWAALARGLHARYGRPALVLGTAAEQAQVQAIVRASPGAAQALARPLTLGGRAALQPLSHDDRSALRGAHGAHVPGRHPGRRRAGRGPRIAGSLKTPAMLTADTRSMPYDH